MKDNTHAYESSKTNMTPDCIFCAFKSSDEDLIIAENESAFAKFDLNPVSLGHAIVIPKDHVVSFFDLTEDQLAKIYALVKDTQRIIENKHSPDGYNIGINDGEAAGRTVHHLHIHIIPRYIGDIPNPRGGVRHVIPGKGNY